MNIYNQTIPYFYIIRNKETGIMYAGSKWAKGCHPDTFMTENGYQTSSLTINSIVEKSGLDVFEILRIDTYCDGLHVYDYETLFLQTNDCANSDNWYNCHNNNRPSPYGTKEYNQMILNKYGHEYVFSVPKIKEKIENTFIARYGKLYYNNREKYKITCLEKYGVDNLFELEEIKQKSKSTKYKKYENENYNNREKAKQTCLEKYGVDHVSKLEEIKRKSEETLLHRYGVSSPTQIKKVCKYCGDYKTIIHESKCIKNPNRKVPKKSDKGNKPKFIYIIKSPNNIEFQIIGNDNMLNFCKNNGFYWGTLRNKKVHLGWTFLDKKHIE